jgi:alpha-1,2-mannosyltransferase
MNDFGKFYYSAQAFLDHRDMYAPSPATDLQFAEAPELRLLNMNPPHFHLIVLPLARLAPERAITIWLAVNLAALVAALLVISRELRVEWTPARFVFTSAGTVAFAGTQSFFATGQLSLLLLLAVTLCWIAARRGRWTAAAVVLGACASVKPFLLVFLPYLVLTRRFRAAAILVATTAVSFGLGLAVFGADAYRSWYRALGESGNWAWEFMNASVYGFFTRVFDVAPAMAPLVVAPALVKAWVVPAVLIGLATFLACRPARDAGQAEDVDRPFGLLLAAAQLMSPLGWIYYMWLPAGPVAAVAMRSRASRPGVDGVRRFLVFIAVVTLAWPMPFLTAFQPHAWATICIASVYFWGTLALWMWLLLEPMR